MNREIAQKALQTALDKGAQKARIIYTEDSQNTFSVLNGEMENLLASGGASLNIQLFVDGRYGTFSTNRMDESEVCDFIQKSILSTKELTPDPARILPDSSLYYKGNGEDLKQNDENYPDIAPSKKREFILSIASEIDSSDQRVISSAQDYEDGLSSLYMIDSNGFQAETSQTFFAVSSECTVKGEGDIRPQNYWYDASMHFDSLQRGCARISLERALAMIGAKKIKSGKYNVVIENSVSSRMLSPVLTAISGGSIQQNYSFLLNSLGQKRFSHKLTLKDTPHIVGDMGSRWFDGEGIATKDSYIIREGVVCQYFLTTYFAQKLNMEPTTESISVAALSPFGASCKDDMIKEAGNGVLITGFNGGNSNGATGDFSFGIEGFYFENGIIRHPIKEMNITGNFLTLWNQIAAIGTDSRNCARMKVPSLLFEGIDLNGI